MKTLMKLALVSAVSLSSLAIVHDADARGSRGAGSHARAGVATPTSHQGGSSNMTRTTTNGASTTSTAWSPETSSGQRSTTRTWGDGTTTQTDTSITKNGDGTASANTVFTNRSGATGAVNRTVTYSDGTVAVNGSYTTADGRTGTLGHTKSRTDGSSVTNGYLTSNDNGKTYTRTEIRTVDKASHTASTTAYHSNGNGGLQIHTATTTWSSDGNGLKLSTNYSDGTSSNSTVTRTGKGTFEISSSFLDGSVQTRSVERSVTRAN